MHFQPPRQLADGTPFGQADAGGALGRQGFARALRYKVAFNFGRQGEGEGYDLGIQRVREFKVVLDGTDLNPPLGTGVQDTHHHHHIPSQTGEFRAYQDVPFPHLFEQFSQGSFF